ncbi:MAG: aminotransferase class I/II-fold pyridoxal phosphate-dependent enzyme [Myxococcota bacterium]|nr:aminotransferase class I/II-fold pyridoxal phosphate-dependent enzyme [Myxococcota bacterium]
MTELTPYFGQGESDAELAGRTFSQVALGMTSSRILVIAYAVKARIASGADVANFTVGDFAPGQFQIPARLNEEIQAALRTGQTNYPPANGTPELRTALQAHYRERLGLDYPLTSFVVASGARPVLYAAYRCLVDPGEVVVTPAPSWNNNNFCHLVGARHVVVATRPEDAFMPTADRLRPHLSAARLLVLCSPMNPAGTMMTRSQMAEICELIVDENRRRRTEGRRALYLIYDQVYWMLAFGDHAHVTPPQIDPEMAAYTIMTDAVSKCFAGTGLRVGWAVSPPHIADKIKSLMTHMGAWAPRPEQIGTAAFLANQSDVNAFLNQFKAGIQARLDCLFEAFQAWHAEGLPIEVIPPQGAIYLSVKLDLIGRPGYPDEDAVRVALLEQAGCAIVPFSAFGDHHNAGWVRFSVGAVSLDDIRACLPRIKAMLMEAQRD